MDIDEALGPADEMEQVIAHHVDIAVARERERIALAIEEAARPRKLTVELMSYDEGKHAAYVDAAHIARGDA